MILLSICSSTVNGANRLLRYPKLLKLFKLMRVIRLMKIARLKVLLQWMRDILHLNPGVVRLAAFIVGVCVIAHYSACLFFFLGEFMLDEAAISVYKSTGYINAAEAYAVVSWTTLEMVTVPNDGDSRCKTRLSEDKQASKNGTRSECSIRDEAMIHDLSPEYQYMIAMYWAVTTMTTVGYGDIVPHTELEYAFAILVMFMGGLTFAYVVGNMARLVGRINLRAMKVKRL